LFVDLSQFIKHLFAPETFSVAITFGGIFWKFAASVKKQMDKKDNEFMKNINDRLKAIEDKSAETHNKIELEVLRLQLLDGMDSKRFNLSELNFFYDKYHALGGDSFVTEKVEEYRQWLRDKEANAKDS
jgi:hypothetical protein